MHEENYKMQYEMEDPSAYLASHDTDTMYFDQEMKHPDRYCLINTEIREVNRHCKRKLFPLPKVPKRHPILDSV